MATYYWVGGSGTWDDTITTNWSLTSGGTGGAGVPTTADSVIFNNLSGLSGATTVQCSMGLAFCRDVNINVTSIWLGQFSVSTGNCSFLGTISASSNISVEVLGVGSATFNASGTIVNVFISGIYSFVATTTISNLYIYIQINLSANTTSIGTVNLQGGGVLNIQSGNMTCSTFNYSGSLNISASRSFIVNTAINVSGTPSISMTATSTYQYAGLTFNGGGLTYAGTVSLTNLSNVSITGANNINTLTLSNRSSSICRQYTFYNDQTITVLNSTSTSVQTRAVFSSDTLGTQRTLNITSSSAANIDLRDINATGASWSTIGTTAGDCGGNSGVTFPAPKVVYWSLAAGGAINTANAWATSSGGTPSLTNFPLAQDTVIFDDTGLSSGGTVSCAIAYNFGSFIFSSRTLPMTLSTSATVNIYGNFTASSVLTVAGTNVITFLGRSPQTFTTAGLTYSWGLTVSCFNTSLTLIGALISARPIIVTAGTFNTGSYNITCLTFSSSTTTYARAITLGASTVTLTSTGSLWFVDSTNLTFSGASSTITLSDTSTSARSFIGGGLTYGSLVIGGATGTSILTIDGSNTFNSISSTKTVAHTISFIAGITTYVTNWSVTGTVGNIVTITASSTINATLSKVGGGTVLCDYMNISRNTAMPANTWYATNSTNGSGNINWTFGPIPVGGNGNFLMFF